LGYQLSKLKAFEAFRGELTGWLIIAFGLVYLVWGLRRAVSQRKQKQVMEKLESPAKAAPPARRIVPWVLFVVFLLGPCEPLIPILMFPAAQMNTMSIALVAGVFGLVTIATMLGMVLLPLSGIRRIRIPALKTWGHALAGTLIILCGAGIQLGL
jgi:sulfite exporter TauE/SafE